jgi:fumarate hydratase subunit alpha
MKRKIPLQKIKETVKRLCIEANTVLRRDVLAGLNKALESEKKGTLSKNMLSVLIDNARIAEDKKIGICQDTGIVAVFLQIGMGVELYGEDLNRAVDEGIREAYDEGCFRKSVVKDPLLRDNTGGNIPGIKHIEFVPGDKIFIAIMPKGFGSENKGRIKMFNPTAKSSEIIDFCVDTVRKAGADACPPYILGIGIGGTMEKCAFLAKKALLRPIDESSGKGHLRKMEEEIKNKCNELNIGVMGLGGRVTCIGVNIEDFATHIAGLPVAVNVSCHALRSASAVI